jgi:uncharacterized protein YndB with AHSA1/START domain
MEAKPLIVECSYNVPIERIWTAITDKEQMKEWYFELDEFRAEKGFIFHFTVGDDKIQYLHECEVLVADAPDKLIYSWTYPEHNNGYSVVTWELFDQGENCTLLKLTHTGLDSFPQESANFALSGFKAGWNFILGESLAKYLKKL